MNKLGFDSGIGNSESSKNAHFLLAKELIEGLPSLDLIYRYFAILQLFWKGVRFTQESTSTLHWELFRRASGLTIPSLWHQEFDLVEWTLSQEPLLKKNSKRTAFAQDKILWLAFFQIARIQYRNLVMPFLENLSKHIAQHGTLRFGDAAQRPWTMDSVRFEPIWSPSDLVQMYLWECVQWTWPFPIQSDPSAAPKTSYSPPSSHRFPLEIIRDFREQRTKMKNVSNDEIYILLNPNCYLAQWMGHDHPSAQNPSHRYECFINKEENELWMRPNSEIFELIQTVARQYQFSWNASQAPFRSSPMEAFHSYELLRAPLKIALENPNHPVHILSLPAKSSALLHHGYLDDLKKRLVLLSGVTPREEFPWSELEKCVGFSKCTWWLPHPLESHQLAPFLKSLLLKRPHQNAAPLLPELSRKQQDPIAYLPWPIPAPESQDSKRLTASEFSLYVECPFAFYLHQLCHPKNIKTQKSQASVQQELGVSIHLLLEKFMTQVRLIQLETQEFPQKWWECLRLALKNPKVYRAPSRADWVQQLLKFLAKQDLSLDIHRLMEPMLLELGEIIWPEETVTQLKQLYLVHLRQRIWDRFLDLESTRQGSLGPHYTPCCFVEHSFRLSLDSLTIDCRIDRVDSFESTQTNEITYEIIDYKVASPKENQKSISLDRSQKFIASSQLFSAQAALYSLAWSQNHPDPFLGQVSLWQLKTGRQDRNSIISFSFAPSKSQYQDQMAQLKASYTQLAQNYLRGDFSKSPYHKSRCQMCSYLNLCKPHAHG